MTLIIFQIGPTSMLVPIFGLCFFGSMLFILPLPPFVEVYYFSNRFVLQTEFVQPEVLLNIIFSHYFSFFSIQNCPSLLSCSFDFYWEY